VNLGAAVNGPAVGPHLLCPRLLKEPQKLPPVLSPEEVKRVLAMAASLRARVMLTLSYGCGLRAGEVVRLRVCDIDSTQTIIRVVQPKGLRQCPPMKRHRGR
jgi:integrase